MISTANKYICDGEQDKAIEILEESLKQKDDSNIRKGVEFANNLKKLKVIYDEANKCIDDIVKINSENNEVKGLKKPFANEVN